MLDLRRAAPRGSCQGAQMSSVNAEVYENIANAAARGECWHSFSWDAELGCYRCYTCRRRADILIHPCAHLALGWTPAGYACIECRALVVPSPSEPEIRPYRAPDDA